MKKILFIILLTVLGAGFFNAAAQKDQPKTTKYEIRHQGMDRTYWLYIPRNLSPDAPLVFILHGYGGKAEGYRPEMVATAKKHGFAVCYPQGAKDGKGKNCWNVGYSFQKDYKTNDVDFLCDLAKYLQKKYGFKKQNTFLTGMSNGGEMCYQMAAQRPDAFTAYAPIAGLTME